MIANTAVLWRWGCAHTRVPGCVWVSGMPEAMYAAHEGRHPTTRAHCRQQAGSLLPVAMQHSVITCSCTQQHRGNSQRHKHTEHATGQDFVHPTLQGLCFPNFPQNQIHKTSSRASAQREYHHFDWIGPTIRQPNFMFFCIFQWWFLEPLPNQAAIVVVLFEVKISLNAKKVECL